jgi:stromal membrane-associated protein
MTNTLGSFEGLKEFANQPPNRTCADCCDTGDSMKHFWCSTNLGIFICINCAGAHRALGTHVSQTVCLELDGIQSAAVIEHIMKIGNKVANIYWLSHGSRGVKKAQEHIELLRKDRKIMEKFIEAKYCGKDFTWNASELETERKPRRPSGAERVCAGVLRIRVLKGVALNGDRKDEAKPFLTFQCGSNSVTSKVGSTLNPEWNQTLMMNLTQSNPKKLNICCWDSNFVVGPNGTLGFAEVAIDDIGFDVECKKIIKLDTQGEIHCIFELTPLE